MALPMETVLEKSLVQEVLDKLERGEPVDFPQLVVRQTAQIVRANELFALDAVRRLKDADDGIIRVG